MIRLILCLWVGLAVVFAPLTPVWAQDVPLSQDAGTQSSLDYEAWAATASRAERALEAGKASNSALETLRTQIAEWRDQFLEAQNTNQARIATIQSQITALGPVPENGEEAEDIAARRETLNTQLARLQAPVLAAEEAHSRAAGLIAEIDRIIRERQAEELLSLGPTPLNPVHWPDAAQELLDTLRTLWRETQSNWQNEVRRIEFQDTAPVSVGLGLLGLILLLRGRAWFGRLGLRARRLSRRGGEVWHFVVSLGKVLMPFVGLLLLSQALIQTGFIGLRGATVLNHLPAWGLIILIARWLADRLFPDGEAPAPLPVDPEQRGLARRQLTLLAVLGVLGNVAQVLGDVGNFSAEAEAVVGFPLVCAIGVVLFRMGQLIASQISEAEDDSEITNRARIMRLVYRGAQVVAVVGPLMWAIGYRHAAEALVYPTVMTFFLLGLLVVLRKLVDDVYALVTRAEENHQEALWPVLIGFLLTLAALPILALIWGVRVAELTEIWTRFRAGFTIGDTQISPTDFLVFALVFAIGYMATRILQGAMRSSILPKTKIDTGGQTAIVSGLGYVGIFLSALIAITSAGLDLSSIAIVAGALSVGIGFGLQNIVSNFVSGIILLIERPISEGDWIEVGGQMGHVRNISVRSTRIETFDRTDVIVPNADLVSGTVTNFTRGNTIGRVIVPVGVAYGTDTRKVEKILTEIAEAHPMVLLNPPPGIIFQGFGADSMDFEIRAILRNVNWKLQVLSDMNHEIAERFAQEGIEIPFAQRDVWLRNPEVLRGETAPAAATAPATPPAAPEGAGATATAPQPPDVDEPDADSPDGETPT